jgi:hypothetical protein
VSPTDTAFRLPDEIVVEFHEAAVFHVVEQTRKALAPAQLKRLLGIGFYCRKQFTS